MKILKPHPFVWIFNEAIEEPQKIIDFYENNFEWEDWYTFGKMVDIKFKDQIFNNFPNKEEWIEKTHQTNLYTEEEFLIIKQILDKFYDTTKLFMEENNFNKQKLGFFSFNLAKYIGSPVARMNYHTDYQQEKFKIPGKKMHTTTLFYLNDNYKGGEISFIELNEKQEIIWDYTYKPKAGDIIVFSSKHPLYHGVKTVENGNKYIIRTYWQNFEEPNEEWIEGVSKFGEEEWRKIKEEEAKKIRVETIGRDYKGEYINIQYTDKKKWI